jgi:hypothetical protein
MAEPVEDKADDNRRRKPGNYDHPVPEEGAADGMPDAEKGKAGEESGKESFPASDPPASWAGSD